MPRSSKALLSDETLHELESQFYSFLDSLSSDERKKFFAEFLTNEEKMMMYKRLALYWCLLEGYSLAKIQQMIGVTHDTTRVYNKKKNTLSEEFKELVKRIAKSEAIEMGAQKQSEPVEEISQQEQTPEVVEEVIETQVVEETVMAEPTEGEAESSSVEEAVSAESSDEPREAKEESEMHEEMTHHEEAHPMEEKPTDTSVDDEQNNIWAVKHDEESDKKEEGASDSNEPKKEETEGMMPTENSNEEKETSDDEGGEKKKSGIAKFFGF